MDIGKYHFDYENDKSSDQQTISQSNPTYDHLLYENKMKTQALAKASNLIEILKCELEVEKNAHEEALHEAVQNARDQTTSMYRGEIQQLQIKIQILEREIERQNSARKQTYQFSRNKELLPTRNSTIVRNSSTSSLHQKSKEKKLSRDKSTSKIPDREPSFSFEKQYYKQMLKGYEERNQVFVSQMKEIFNREKEELQTYEQLNQQYDVEFDQLYQQQEIKEDETGEYMRIIIEKQETIINKMKLYQMELEDLIKGFILRGENLIVEESESSRMKGVDLQKPIREVKLKFSSIYNNLVEENHELRCIIDEMIKLIKQKKQYK